MAESEACGCIGREASSQWHPFVPGRTRPLAKDPFSSVTGPVVFFSPFFPGHDMDKPEPALRTGASSGTLLWNPGNLRSYLGLWNYGSEFSRRQQFGTVVLVRRLNGRDGLERFRNSVRSSPDSCIFFPCLLLIRPATAQVSQNWPPEPLPGHDA